MHCNPRKLARYVAVAVTISVLVVPSALHAQEQRVANQEEWSPTQREVWEQEKKYWQLRNALDIEAFMSLWDEEFVGWSGPGIISRADIRKIAAKVAERRKPGALNYELIPRAVRVHGNLGITFYTAIFRDSTGAKMEEVRFHHSWRKENGQWKIIEGLSAAPLDQQE